MIPGASSPSWRKPSWGGGIPGCVSEGESGLGRPSPSPGFGAGPGPGLLSFAYICIYASFTPALWQGPTPPPQRGRGWERHLGRGQGGKPKWLLSAEASKPSILVQGPSTYHMPQSLNQTHGFFPRLRCLPRPGTSESFLPLCSSGTVTGPRRVSL